MRKNRNGNQPHIFDMAFKEALYDNAYIHLDDFFQDPELKHKYREFLRFFFQKAIEKIDNELAKKSRNHSKRNYF